MRLDRLITLGLVQPARQILARLTPRTGPAAGRQTPASAPCRAEAPAKAGPPLPVLMYHSISDDPEPAFSPYYKVCTSPARFAEHMQWLAEWGYRGVTLTEGLAALRGQGKGKEGERERDEGAPSQETGAKIAPSLQPSDLRSPASGLRSQKSGLSASPPAKRVAITFDDGFRDFHTEAWPVLRRHGFTATMYLPTAFIGDERKTFKGHECLTWSEVRELAAAGMEFGSHTVNHPTLVETGWPEIEHELGASKATIEQHLDRPCTAFAYPYAFPSANREFTTRFKQLLHSLGYASCATTEIGRVHPGDDALQVKRLPANTVDDAALLGAKLAGAYDWLHGLQTLKKRLKASRIRS